MTEEEGHWATVDGHDSSGKSVSALRDGSGAYCSGRDEQVVGSEWTCRTTLTPGRGTRPSEKRGSGSPDTSKVEEVFCRRSAHIDEERNGAEQTFSRCSDGPLATVMTLFIFLFSN